LSWVPEQSGGAIMTVFRYCTPEWLRFSAEAYRSTPRFQQEMAKLTTRVCFLVKAEPAWGIEKDILFGAFVRQGGLEKLDFLAANDAKAQAEFIIAATPQEWKSILRKERKFITDFMLGRLVLEQGSKVGVLAIAPHANTFIEALTQAELQFPDEMSPEELAAFRSYLAAFRQESGV
jgi:hypothetical protein